MKPIIRVENLCKQFRIGVQRSSYTTLRDSFTQAVRASFKRFGGNGGASHATIWALTDVTFEVVPGEVLGIIGRNGAGKSTLLKILSRITEPTTGTVDLFGRIASLLEVGTGFHPELTGRDNVYLNGAILGMKRREITRNFDEIVAFAEIDKFIDTPVKHYSSGMYMRLAFAVAAHLEPEILVIDEVLAVGDAAFQKKCLRRMGEAANEGRTVLFVSHNISAIQQLCNRSILLQAGRIQHQGNTDLVVANYLERALPAESGHFDLTRHADRPAKYIPLITHLAFLSDRGSATTWFYPGDRFIVELMLEPEVPIKEPRIAFSIEDSLARTVTTVASYFQSEPLGAIETSCRVRCVIPLLQLGAGRYVVNVSIHNREFGLLDFLPNAGWFDVIWNNSYGNAEPYHHYYGPVLTQASWHRMS